MRIQTPPESGRPGILLRQLERSDIPAWYAYLCAPEVLQHTSWNLSAPADLLPFFDAIDSTESSSVRRLAIVDEASARLIGTIGFHSISDVHRNAEIAYDLAPLYWGKGIAAAVISTVTRWAFREYGFVRIQGTVLENNVRSARVLKRCQFKYEGTLMSFRMVRGAPGDFQMYALLNAEVQAPTARNA